MIKTIPTKPVSASLLAAALSALGAPRNVESNFQLQNTK